MISNNHVTSHVPKLGGCVASARYERSRVRRQRQRHYVTRVTSERRALLAGLDVPQRASHIARAGHYLVVVEETAARQVACMAGQFAAHANITLARLEAVNGADVVQAAAGHVRACIFDGMRGRMEIERQKKMHLAY